MVVDEYAGWLETASELVGQRVRFLRKLTGGEHATTLLVAGRGAEYVVRSFPANDPAVGHEVGILARLEPLGDLVPQLIAYSDEPASPLIVTSRVPGRHPAPNLPATGIASQMAAALARIHRLNGDGLRTAPVAPPAGDGPASTSGPSPIRRP